MKLLFINAEKHPKPNYIAVGPAYMAANIKKEFPGTEIRFINSDVHRSAALFKPDIVLISSVSESYPIAREYARHFSQHGIPAVVGGPHITAAPNSLCEGFTLGAIGEGEHTIIDLLRHFLENNESFDLHRADTIPGIVFRREGDLIFTPPRTPVTNLDSLPFPDRSIHPLSSNYPIIMITSRGCPFNCIYCASSSLLKGVRYHSVDYVVEDVSRIITDFKPKVISFNDDLFCAKISRLEGIVHALNRNGVVKRTEFIATCRAELVTDDLAKLLKSLNTKAVAIGFESGSQKVLRYLKGEQSDVTKNHQAVEVLNRYDIRVIGFFIIGTPIDTNEDIRATSDFIQNNLIDFYSVYPLTPLPGTALWRWCEERDIVSSSEEMDWSLLDLRTDRYIHFPEQVSREELSRWFDRLNGFRRTRLMQSLWYHFKASPLSLIGFLFRQVKIAISRIIEKYFG
jgi:radical SAM superfamily enzyme YgiQ (UPF0313 family)